GSSSINRRDEPVTAPGHCLDIQRAFGRVAHRVPNLLDREIDGLIEVDKRAFGPELGANVVARNQVTGPANQQYQKLERLWLQLHAPSVPATLLRIQVELELSEAIESSRNRRHER